MAAPTATGVAAEILSHFPTINPIQLKEGLMKSVTKSKRLSGKIASGGRINLLKAYQYFYKNLFGSEVAAHNVP